MLRHICKLCESSTEKPMIPKRPMHLNDKTVLGYKPRHIPYREELSKMYFLVKPTGIISSFTPPPFFSAFININNKIVLFS